MKTILILSALCLVAPFAQDSRPTAAQDRKAVERAALDYVDAIYEAKPELLKRSVHPDLVKTGFYRADPKAEYRLLPMTYTQLEKLAGNWNKDGSRANADTVKKVEILDLMDATAAVKVTAVWGVDHMQVGKFDGKWKIIHILWQSHPPKK